MNEKEFLKRVLNEKTDNKELIRRWAIGSKFMKGERHMKNWIGKAAVIATIIIVMSFGTYAVADTVEYNKAKTVLNEIGVDAQDYSKRETKLIYKDIVSNKFELPVTQQAIECRASELGIENPAGNLGETYLAIKNYNPTTATGRITSDQVRKIKKGLSYKEIIDMLGHTKDMGNQDKHIVQYLVDGKKLLTFTFTDESEICNKSGEELLKDLKILDTKNNSDFTFDATVISRVDNWMSVDCPAYDKFDTASVGMAENVVIVFSDNTKASIEDINAGAEVIITYDGEIRESCPPQITATKIVIK